MKWRRWRAAGAAIALIATTQGSGLAAPQWPSRGYADSANETYLWINLGADPDTRGRFIFAVGGAGLFWGDQAATLTVEGDGSTTASYSGAGWLDSTGTFDPLLWRFEVLRDPVPTTVALTASLSADLSSATAQLAVGQATYPLNDGPAPTGADGAAGDAVALLEAQDWVALYGRLHPDLRAALSEQQFVSDVSNSFIPFGDLIGAEITGATIVEYTGLGWDVAASPIEVTFAKNGRQPSYPSTIRLMADGGAWWLSGIDEITPDVTPPSSTAGPLEASSTAATISVPYTASDAGVGVDEVELWWRYRPDEGNPWGTWTLGPVGSSSPLSFSFAPGPGLYEFYTIAVDKAGNREEPPSAADASTVYAAVGWMPSVQVNDDIGTARQSAPDVIIGDDGAAHAVWTDSRLSSSPDIFYSRRDPTSGSWSLNELVNDVTFEAQSGASVAVDSAGNVYAVWTDYRNDRLDPDIYFSKRSAATGTWSTSVRVNDDGAGKLQGHPAIVVSSTGEAVAIWQDSRTTKTHIYSAALPGGGSAWSANVRVSDFQNAVREDPHLAIRSDGVAYAAFVDTRSGTREIWMATRAAGASAWSANVQVSAAPTGTNAQWNPEIGVDDAGGITVVWERSFDSQASREIRARHRSPGSATWDAIEVIGPDGVFPSVAVRPDGRAYAAWHRAGVTGREYDPSTNSWGAPELVNDTSEGTADVAVTADDASVLVLWASGPFSEADIRARLKLD